jgi:heme-degrading monooxygenase HmoA
MKRPIAELRTLTLHAGTETEWLRDEHETWQILRRKPGYITHHLYSALREQPQRLVYSEWESRKALDGARQRLQGTPLARRARAAFVAPPERMVVELIGPVTSTKGLDLPETAVAVTAVTYLQANTPGAQERLAKLGSILAAQPGHITHVLFRGFDDPALAGTFAHWQDLTALEKAIASVSAFDPSESLPELAYVQYQAVHA